MTITDLQWKFRGRLIKFALDLDPEDTSDCFIIHGLTNGQTYEAEIAHILLRALKEGDTAIDVGANVGFFTILMSRLVGMSGIVQAFEPSTVNLEKLDRNLKVNEPGTANVELVRLPVWCKPQLVTFYYNSDHASSSALVDPGEWFENVKSKANPITQEMQATTLDEMMMFDEPKLIKIDTEGCDQKVLEGAASMLKRCRPPYIIVELNPFGMKQAGDSAESLRKFMFKFGYDMFYLHANGTLPTLVPDNTAVSYVNGVVVKNVMFSTLGAVGELWPEAYE